MSHGQHVSQAACLRGNWRVAISNNVNDSKRLWSKVSALLKQPQAPSSTITHSANVFADHFRSKVDAIHTATLSTTKPKIDIRACTGLHTMKKVTAEEVTKVINRAPVKHCSLDPAPTWLVKRLVASAFRSDLVDVQCITRRGSVPVDSQAGHRQTTSQKVDTGP